MTDRIPCDCDSIDPPQPTSFTIFVTDATGQPIGDAVTYKQFGNHWLATTVEKPDGTVRDVAGEG